MKLTSPEYRAITRYAHGDPDPYALAVSLREGAYLSHHSALVLHGLDDETSLLYVNKEQTAKPPPDQRLTQTSIDRAFRGRGRVSNYVFQGAGYTFTLLSGKQTGRLQVEPLRTRGGTTVDVTGLERTLVDAAVRPSYCGGVQAVARAYWAAKGRASPKRLLEILAALDYAYPYHQAIGFYMQIAGYPKDELERVAAIPMTFKFYLTYGIQAPAYSEEWQIYYPRDVTLRSVP